MRVTLFALAAVGIGVTWSCERVSADTAEQQQRKCLLGIWDLAAIEAEGERENITKDDNVSCYLQFSLSMVTRSMLGGGAGSIVESPYTLGGTKELRVIEMAMDDAPVKALYKLEGDTLLFVWLRPGRPVPTTFVTKPGDEHEVWIYKRRREVSSASPKEDKTPREVKEEQLRLQGVWQVLATREKGRLRDIGKNDFSNVRLAFSGNTVESRAYVTQSAFIRDVGTYTVLRGKTHNGIDLTWSNERDEEDRFARAIYKVEGDTLTICMSTGKERPTSFESSTDRKWVVIICVRKKD